jgi:hypothetical protein
VDKDEVWVQLATRIPTGLRFELKLHSVKTDTSIMDFVIQAIAEKLKRDTGRKRRAS